MSSFMLRRRASSSGSWQLLCPNPEAKSGFFPFLLFSTLSESQPRNLYRPSSPQNLPNPFEKHRILDSGVSPFPPNTAESPFGSLQNHPFPSSIFISGSKPHALSSGYVASGENVTGSGVLGLPMVRSLYSGRGSFGLVCLFGTQAAVEPSSCDGTVDRIIASEWPILDVNESDWKSHAAAIAQSIHLIKKRLQCKKLLVRLDMLSAEVNKPDLWNDPVHARKISREHGSLLDKMKEVQAFERELLEHIDVVKLAREENDTELESVQAGAGGTESNDWATMVMQMYKMWAQRHRYDMTVVDEMPGEIAGIKQATIKVDGEYAFGYAKAEVGVHRLVWISPFDSNKRRHTSFAAVAVTPILGDASEHVQNNESDLHIEQFRSGGAGGQHANTTDSALRIVHIPTGITATCQNERSQHQNKASAMAVIQSRVEQLEMACQNKMNAQYSQSLTDITWGSQIRSYVLQPYRMVKDLRTNYEVSDPDSVLEVDVDGFILSYLSACLDRDEDDN
ncbi:peptide chain release factor 1-like [Pyrus ussuriensis x Pyrus communis]|uniref:Peptide chain release factor 1-like n=1 Tax=Pyrus ussuriensis x Pyrus communis TaxID=2448454 RepID=A0A5N5H172_9ROSA|nr:peptide chain release factor 1-like [Pyrus ussuriensis x Pyrus communis]